MKNKKEIIKVKKLTYQDIFHNFNLVINEGDFISITGVNNSGKTTLIKIISSLISTKEFVFYKNKAIETINQNELFTNMGIVILEDKMVFMSNTVEEELFSILENLKYEQKEKILEYQKIVRLLGIEEILIENPNNLCRANKVKILLAAALLSKPNVLLLDDICSTMTKKQTKEILDIIKILNKENKLTIIMTTHNLNESLCADYLYILDEGKIIISGLPTDVMKEDNKINKLGLTLPFMIDLSVKLNDYDLLNEIELDMDRMVDKLWK